MTKIRKAKSRKSWNALLLLSTVLGGASGQAWAQDEPTLDEVIITAQKREQNLQDVPISVQVLGQEQLEQLNITEFTDYAYYLPSLAYSASYGPGYNRPFMRGVASGENGNHSGSMPSVGTYLDEQPITTITGNLDLHLYDVARVEVLAGPQGTLYGASSQAGTVRIITNRPDPSGFSSSYDLEVNTIADGDWGQVGEGYVNIPLSNRAAVRLIGWAEHAGGYIDNVLGMRTYPTSGIVDTNPDVAEDDYNSVDTYGARASLGIDLNDTWTVTPQVMGQWQESHGVFAQDSAVGDLAVTHWFPEWNEDSWIQSALTVEGAVGNFDVVFAASHLNRDVDSNQDYADYGYFYDSFLGYGCYFTDNTTPGACDATPLGPPGADVEGDPINPAQQVEGRDSYERSTYELRIASPAENRLRFIGGVFFQHAEHDIHQRYVMTGFRDAYEVPGWTDTIWLTEQTRTDEETAVFGELSFDFTDRLTGTVGARSFETENSLVGFFGFSGVFGIIYGVPTLGEGTCFGPPFRGAPCTNLDKSTSETGELYRVNLQYSIDDDRMLYATYSEGFRPGGINRRGTLPPYGADYLANHEVGWKTDWADGRLRWNGALFFEQWENFQFAFLGGSGLTEIQNAGDAEITGLETDFAFAATDRLTISGSATWLDAELTSASIPDTVAGTRLPVSPELKANATARYEFTLGNWEAFLQGSAVYQGDSTIDIRMTEAGLIGTLPDWWIVDLSAGIERDGTRMSLYIDNLFDERAITGRYTECAIGTCGAAPDAIFYDVVAQPLTVGVRFGQSF